MIKTRLIVTWGPSLSRRSALRSVIRHADVIRMNFAHGDREYWLAGMESASRAAKTAGREVAFLADLPGPKIRVGHLKSDVQLKKGAIVTFVHDDEIRGGDKVVPVEYPLFYKDARKGTHIDIGDGDAKLSVMGVEGRHVLCKAIDDGVIKARKGIAIMGGTTSASAPTDEDVSLARFALKNGFDFIGMSYIKSAGNVVKLRRAVGAANIIAKIEMREAVDDVRNIAEVADALMVARGDLALNIKLEHIPEAQTKIIEAARKANRPVIVATQLLASMVTRPSPTRAEVNDIANAVIGRTDCLLLSDETTVGKFPAAAVGYLVRTARVAEGISRGGQVAHGAKITAVNMAIAFAAAELAEKYRTDCIFIPTQTGATARILSELRPNALLIALSASPRVRRSLSIYYGLETMPIRSYTTIDQMLGNVKEIAIGKGMKNYIVVSGSPNTPGRTDTLKYVSL